MSLLTSLLTSLRTDGFARLETPWAGADAFVAHLREELAYPAHIVAFGDRKPRDLNVVLDTPLDAPGIPFSWDFACHTMASTLRAPGFLDYVLPFTEIARDYFDGEPPLLYSVNSFWKKPLGQPGWYYDTDDRKSLALFIYGTPILTLEDGPHAYAGGTHLWPDAEKDGYCGKTPPEDRIVNLYGPAGTAFLTSTRGLHNGVAPAAGRAARLLTWVRWGVSDPPKSYHNDELQPVPASALPPVAADAAMMRATKLIIDWSR